MRIAIIDDDQVVRDNLKTLLAIYVPDHEIVCEADGVQAGLAAIKSHKPDIVLLDVEMKDGSGFDLLSIYGELDFKLIFVTGHNGFAIKAFKYSAIDYVLKPVDPEELIAAIGKAEEAIDHNFQRLQMAALTQNKKVSFDEQKILLKDAETVYLVSVKDIIRCESKANYTMFFMSDERQLVVSKTLKEYDSLFEGEFFFRAHQSHLINLLHFDRYDKRDGGVVFMKDGSTLPVAVRKKDALLAALEEM